MSAFRNKIIISSLCLFFSTLSIKADNSFYSRKYTWEYADKTYTMNYQFKSSSYLFYKKVKRTYGDFSVYINESTYYPVIEAFALSLKKYAEDNDFNDWQTVEFIAAFVQYLNYKDDGTYEYPRYPIETLVDLGGDCEDTAILLDAILRALGYDCVLLSPKGHMGVGIAGDNTIDGVGFEYNQEKYFYIETTSEGWGVGQYPTDLSADVIVYDPGQLANATILSEDEISSASHTTYAQNAPIKISPANKNVTTPSSKNVSSEMKYDPEKFHFQSTTQKENVDEIIVNGERQKVVTTITTNQ